MATLQHLVVATFVCFGLNLVFATSVYQNDKEVSAVKDDEQLRHWNGWGGGHWGNNGHGGGGGGGHGGNNGHGGGGGGGQGGSNALDAFCEMALQWLESIDSNVTSSNGTEPATAQEVLVDYLQVLCPNDTSTRSGDQQGEQRFFGWWNIFGNQNNNEEEEEEDEGPLDTFCDRTQEWIGTTASNDTNPIQQVFVNFLGFICPE